MRKKIAFVLILTLIVVASAFCDSGDYITVICRIKEIKPTFSINTDSFENGTWLYVSQDNLARYYGAYKLDVTLTALSGEYEIVDMHLAQDCESYEIDTGLVILAQYNGKTTKPHTIASWIMAAKEEDVHGTVHLVFQAI